MFSIRLSSAASSSSLIMLFFHCCFLSLEIISQFSAMFGFEQTRIIFVVVFLFKCCCFFYLSFFFLLSFIHHPTFCPKTGSVNGKENIQVHIGQYLIRLRRQKRQKVLINSCHRQCMPQAYYYVSYSTINKNLPCFCEQKQGHHDQPSRSQAAADLGNPFVFCQPRR